MKGFKTTGGRRHIRRPRRMTHKRVVPPEQEQQQQRAPFSSEMKVTLFYTISFAIAIAVLYAIYK